MIYRKMHCAVHHRWLRDTCHLAAAQFLIEIPYIFVQTVLYGEHSDHSSTAVICYISRRCQLIFCVYCSPWASIVGRSCCKWFPRLLRIWVIYTSLIDFYEMLLIWDFLWLSHTNLSAWMTQWIWRRESKGVCSNFLFSCSHHHILLHLLYHWCWKILLVSVSSPSSLDYSLLALLKYVAHI